MEQNRTQLAKKQMLKALESSLGIVTTALKSCDLSRTNYYKWLKEDEVFAQAVNDVELIAKDFVMSKFYECIKDKVPSVVIHGAKNILGMNETNKIDVTSGDEPIHMPLITFYKTETES
jgi:ACT domain-containing protein